MTCKECKPITSTQRPTGWQESIRIYYGDGIEPCSKHAMVERLVEALRRRIANGSIEAGMILGDVELLQEYDSIVEGEKES